MTIPLYLTLGRLFLAPLFLVIYLYYGSLGIGVKVVPYLLIAIIIVCGVSDFLDGFFARKRNAVTDLGKLLDPMADSLVHLSMFFTFTQGPVQLPLLLVILFFYRDSIISTLRTLCALRGETLAARRSGKIKTVIQGVSAGLIALLMIPHSLGVLGEAELRGWSVAIISVTLAYTLYSGVEYVRANSAHIKRALLK